MGLGFGSQVAAGAALQALVEALYELAIVNTACGVTLDFFRMF